VLVYADCDPKASFYAMNPLPDRKVPRGWQKLGGGEHWEMFVNHRNKGRQLFGDFAFRDVMEELFGSLSLQIVRHDDDGIEVVAELVEPGRAEGRHPTRAQRRLLARREQHGAPLSGGSQIPKSMMTTPRSG
jgi:hypothetical protein